MFDGLLPLGLPIVRSFLRLLGPGDPDLGDVLSDFQDLAGSRAALSDRRAAARSFESVADAALKKIESSLRHEFRDAKANDVNAAVEAVKLTLNTKLSEKGLAEVLAADVDPQALQRKLLEAGGRRYRHGLFDDTARNLFDLLLTETTASICQLVTRFRDFTPNALIRLLQSDRTQLEYLARAQDALSVLLARTSTDSTDSQEAAFEVAYLRSIARTHDRLELYGLDLSWEVRSYSLTTAYLSLQGSMSLTRSPSSNQVGFVSDYDATDNGDVSALLSKSNHLVISGPAGSGKTTILQWLAVSVARRRLPSELSHLNGKFPVFVRLRKHNGPPAGLDALLSESARTELTPPPNGWMIRKLNEGKLLFLVDGLDEVPKSEQAAVVDWINDLSDDGPKCPVFMTSRPSAKEAMQRLRWTLPRKENDREKIPRRQPFAVVEVLPMDAAQVTRFVAHWHKSVIEGRERTEANEAWEIVAARAARAILASRGHRQLASTPLLCAVMCALFHARDTSLPKTRAETYEVALTLLLNDRDLGRGVSVVDNLGLEARHKRRILQHVSEWMLINELSEVSRSRLTPIVDRALQALSVPGSPEPRRVLDALVERSGVLRDVGHEVIDFVHRTFMEYLAAQALMDNDRVELLVENAHKSTWNEAVVLAEGHGIRRQRELLLAGLMERARSAEGSNRLTLIATCAGCVESMVEVSPEQRADVATLLAEIVPPSSSAVADALARAGELVLPALQDATSDADLNHNEVSASLRCLASIGGSRAVEIIAMMRPALLLDHASELVEIWPEFELQEFFDVVFAPLNPSSDVDLIIEQVGLLPFTRDFHARFRFAARIALPPRGSLALLRNSRLSTLAVSEARLLELNDHVDGGVDGDENSPRGLAVFAHIDGLEALTLDGLDRLDSRLRPAVSNTVKRVALGLQGGFIDLGCLAVFPRLERVRIVGAGEVQSLEAIAQLQRLDSLEFEYVHASSEPWRLTPLTVRTLRVEEAEEEFDVETLIESCPSLGELIVASVDSLTDMACIAPCEELDSVLIADCPNLANVNALLEAGPFTQCQIIGSGIFDSETVERLIEAGIEIDAGESGTDHLVLGPYGLVADTPAALEAIRSEESLTAEIADERWVGERDGESSEEDEGLTVYESLDDYLSSSLDDDTPDE